jgi:hypothetical protein
MEGATFSRNYSRIDRTNRYLRIALLAIIERTESESKLKNNNK